MTDTHSRYRGALLGLAAGDALGTTLEFLPPGAGAVHDIVGGGAHHLAAGQWTDDTSMALCLAESLVERGGFDARDQMERYLRWWRDGYLSSTGDCFDIGIATSGAIGRFERDSDPYAGSTDPKKAGNGSIMRLAPVPMFYAADPAEAVRRSGESSRTTHGAVEAIDACRYLGGLIWGALHGVPKAELLGAAYAPVPGLWQAEPLAPRVAEVAAGSYWAKDPPAIRGTGYVVESLEAALWALSRSETYEEGALLAVNLCQDADTTGAVYGQLAGALYGEGGIPARWRRILALRETIEGLADRLYAAAYPGEAGGAG